LTGVPAAAGGAGLFDGDLDEDVLGAHRDLFVQDGAGAPSNSYPEPEIEA
jgi:hypothetical protein